MGIFFPSCSAATPGVPGDPGYMQLIFMRYRDGRRQRWMPPLVEMVPKGQDLYFSLSPDVHVNLKKGTIKVSRGETDVAQFVCAAFAASVLYLLVQPRHSNMALAATLTNGSKKARRICMHNYLSEVIGLHTNQDISVLRSKFPVI